MNFFNDVRIEVKFRSNAPPIPYEDYGVCSGEACAFYEWIACQNMAIHKGRDKDSRLAFQLLKEKKAEDIVVFGGGIIMPDDIPV
jgi:hypothetical protein